MRSHTASAKRRGLSEEQIRAIGEPGHWSAVFTPAEVVVLELADQLCRDAHHVGPDLGARLRQHYEEPALAELLLVCGQAHMNNRVGDAARQLFRGE